MTKNYNNYTRDYNRENYQLFNIRLNKKYEKSIKINDYLKSLTGKERNEFIRNLIINDIKKNKQNMQNI